MKKLISIFVMTVISFVAHAQVIVQTSDELLLQDLENPKLSRTQRNPQTQLLIQVEKQMSQGPMGKGQISFTRKMSQPDVESFVGVQTHNVLVQIDSAPYCLKEILTIKGLIYHGSTNTYDIQEIKISTSDAPESCV
jgi:hypothetical protein